MLQYIWIGLGGFIGVNARYLIQQWAIGRWGIDFPYGTMLANVSGSFVIGFFLTLIAGQPAIPDEARLFVVVGFLGGFTTFSSFSFETFRLIEQGNWSGAGLNFIGNTALGLAGVVLGVVLANLIRQGGH